MIFKLLFFTALSINISLSATGREDSEKSPGTQACDSLIYGEFAGEKLESEISKIKKQIKALNPEKNLKLFQEVVDQLYLLMLQKARLHNSVPGQDIFALPMMRYYYPRVYGTGSSTRPEFSDENLKEFQLMVKKGKLYHSDGKTLFDTGYSNWIYCIVGDELYAAIDSAQTDKGKIRHSSICRGEAVKAAGELRVERGRLKKINTNSGRYRLPPILLEGAELALVRMGVDVSQTRFKFNFRDEAFLSSSDMDRLKQAGVPVTSDLIQRFERGKILLEKMLVKLNKIDKNTSTDDVFEVYDFFVDWGQLEEPNSTHVAQIFSKYVTNPEIKVSRRKELAAELYPLAVYLNEDLITKTLKRYQEKCRELNGQFDSGNCDKISRTIERKYFGKLKMVL